MRSWKQGKRSESGGVSGDPGKVQGDVKLKFGDEKSIEQKRTFGKKPKKPRRPRMIWAVEWDENHRPVQMVWLGVEDVRQS